MPPAASSRGRTSTSPPPRLARRAAYCRANWTASGAKPVGLHTPMYARSRGWSRSRNACSIASAASAGQSSLAGPPGPASRTIRARSIATTAIAAVRRRHIQPTGPRLISHRHEGLAGVRTSRSWSNTPALASRSRRRGDWLAATTGPQRPSSSRAACRRNASWTPVPKVSAHRLSRATKLSRRVVVKGRYRGERRTCHVAADTHRSARIGVLRP